MTATSIGEAVNNLACLPRLSAKHESGLQFHWEEDASHGYSARPNVPQYHAIQCAASRVPRAHTYSTASCGPSRESFLESSCQTWLWKQGGSNRVAQQSGGPTLPSWNTNSVWGHHWPKSRLALHQIPL